MRNFDNRLEDNRIETELLYKIVLALLDKLGYEFEIKGQTDDIEIVLINNEKQKASPSQRL